MDLEQASGLTALAFSLLFMWELTTGIAISPDYYFKNIPEDAPLIEEESKKNSTQSLTLIVGTLASLSFLLGLFINGDKSSIGEPLFLLILALSFFLLTYRIDTIISVARLVLRIQYLLLYYGLLFFSTGLAFAYSVYDPPLAQWLIVVPIIFLLFRTLESAFLFKSLKIWNDSQSVKPEIPGYA